MKKEKQELRAVVTTDRNRGVATLQWRVLISEKLIAEGDGGMTVVPVYGETVAKIERPVEEFYEQASSLSEYVERWLARPKRKRG